MVGHDFICCSECGAYARAGEIYYGAHQCRPCSRERFLVERLRRELDSGRLPCLGDRVASTRPEHAFYEYSVWCRQHGR